MTKKQRPPSIKAKRLIRGLVAGKSMKRAALDAGYGNTPNAARVSGWQALQKPTVQADFRAALEKAGLGFDAMAREIKKGLNEGEYGKHSDYLKIAVMGLIPRQEAEGSGQGAFNLHLIFNGGGAEDQRGQLADMLVTMRTARGLHPTQNRRMTTIEAEEFKK